MRELREIQPETRERLPSEIQEWVDRIFNMTAPDEVTRVMEALALNGAQALAPSSIQGKALMQNPLLTATERQEKQDEIGFEYSLDQHLLIKITVGLNKKNQFVIKFDRGQNQPIRFDLYGVNGVFLYTTLTEWHEIKTPEAPLFEPLCPILNFLYQVLHREYQSALDANSTENAADKTGARKIEACLRRIDRAHSKILSYHQRRHDPSIESFRAKTFLIEQEPFYTWVERAALIKKIKGERQSVIHTKARVHQRKLILTRLAVLGTDIKDALIRLTLRPKNNILGILDRILIDPIRWFGKVVRNNMGYSIALAIYSPFTFFFITQPMNPHAMWAVGKVRSAALSLSEFKNPFQFTFPTFLTNEAAPEATPAPLIANTPYTHPSKGSLLLSTDHAALNSQSWAERMSHFKAMQIAYEKNLEFAPRFGRLEHMETQLNWPLMIEASWLETERYRDRLNLTLLNSKAYSTQFIQYVQAEKSRVEQVQLYLWDKNIRFILDHPYTMMDDSKEQVKLDHYIARAFINLEQMTQTLQNRFQGLPTPMGYEKIRTLAKAFEKETKASGQSLRSRLKANSMVINQQDPSSSDELRASLKRQWEILYLLQNKTQEASNSGLQMYIWSIRNTVWIFQSLYSAKREELGFLEFVFNKNTKIKPVLTSTQKGIDQQLEGLTQMLILEFASLHQEIGQDLKNDIESTQRKTLIQSLDQSLIERENLLVQAKLI